MAKVEVTDLELAAFKLNHFLRENVAPENAGHQKIEWGVQLVCDNVEDAEKLGDLLSELEKQCKLKGIL